MKVTFVSHLSLSCTPIISRSQFLIRREQRCPVVNTNPAQRRHFHTSNIATNGFHVKTTSTSAMLHAFRVAQFFVIGYTGFGARGFKDHSQFFNPKALDVDLTGRNILVTGATSGLGRATAHALAERKATVHIICRDEQRGAAVRKDIVSKSSGADVRIHRCDISSLADIARLADEFVQDGVAVHVLINNAGIMRDKVVKSVDGFESSFATNSLGTFALTEMLRPALELEPNARVVTVSSGGMLTEHLEVDDLEGKSLQKDDESIDASAQYSRCKRHQVAMTEFWARHNGNSFWAATMHPGWADTPGVKSSMPEFYDMMKKRLRTEEEGADTIIYLAAAGDVKSFKSGQFFFDRRPASKHLWLGGTEYKESEADHLVQRLRTMIEDKGFSLPK